MSRRTRQECNFPLYQIEALDFSRRNGQSHNYGTDVIGSVSWQYRGQEYNRQERMKQADKITTAPRRTFLRRFRDNKSLQRWAKRIGGVISYRKVDTAPYTNNIEHLNLRQNPINIEIDKQEFEIGRDFVITRSGLTTGQIIDIGITK